MIDRNKVSKIVKDSFSNQCDIPLEKIAEHTTFDSAGLDSLDITEMAMEIEDKLEKQNYILSFDESNNELKSVGEIINYVVEYAKDK
jgi:acyl carrier protein